MSEHYLRQLFEPKSIAVFGTSERCPSVGATVFKNLLDASLKGELFPINPIHSRVFGQIYYKNLASIDTDIELAVITTPAPSVVQIIAGCGIAGIKSAVILSAGFREVGDEGRELELKVFRMAKRYGIRFVGHNCLGATHHRL
ncbi:MAG: acetyltransferase [Lentisphaeria bacterium]|jgi:acetyltransferase